MKPLFLVLMVIFSFQSCGKKENKSNSGEIVVSNNPPVNNTEQKDCELHDIGETIPSTCTTIKFNDTYLSKVEQLNDKIILIASRKNSGTTASRRFDTLATLETAVDINIPKIISAVGNPSSKKRLYIRFNNSIDCNWFSKSNSKYEKPRCFINAERDDNNKTGFVGGTEVSNTSISSVVKIEMSIYESSGNDAVTIATAEFTFQ
ncbi:MAG: hypothetical protein M9962_09375 [Oligoflexia bacterium]|nr:hypothetical protein [Oligoflexia bacterium]